MTTATSVGSFGVPIADRIASWLREHPEATEYCLNTEEEAIELLSAIAATIKAAMREAPPGQARQIKPIRNAMIRACAQKQAIAYIRELNREEQLEFLGVDIVVPEEVVH